MLGAVPIVGIGAAAPRETVTDAQYFHVEYFCPRQARTWQRRARPILGYGAACDEARMMKPPAGLARVLTLDGRELYRV